MSNEILAQLYHKGSKKTYCLSCKQKFDNPKKCIDHLNHEHGNLVLAHTSTVRENLDKNAPCEEVDMKESSEDTPLIPPPMAWIVCESRESAIHLKEELSKLPQDFFLKCFLPCRVDGKECLEVEDYKTDPYPVAGHLRETAIKNIIDMAVKLDSKGMIHANFEKIKLVEVNHLPKHYSVPAKLPNFNSLVGAIDQQQSQLCDLIDHIVGKSQHKDSTYIHFRKYLLKSKTVVDLQSMLLHPFVTAPNKLPFFYVNCHMIQSRTSKLQQTREFNAKFGDHNGYRKWIYKVEGGANKVLKHQLQGRVVKKMVLPYHETPFEMHAFFWDLIRHVNEKGEEFESLEEIHAEVVKLFPEYVLEMFEYVHDYGLNAHFGPDDYALQILEKAKTIVEDKSFSIANLTATCKMISYMLAKFHSLCGNMDAKSRVGDVAEVLETSIQDLETLTEKHKTCALFKFHTVEKMLSEDKVLLTSVRFVYGALCFLNLVIADAETEICILRALRTTSMKFQPYYKDEFFKPSISQAVKAVKWPDKRNIKKLVGENFILKESTRNQLEMDIRNLCSSFIAMLDT